MWSIFIEYYPLFRRLERTLAARPWFAEGWAISIGNADGLIYLQLYKPGWHNGNGRGIHLETWVSGDVLAVMSAPVVMHVEREVPSRELFNRLFIERAADVLDTLDDYRVSKRNIMERCARRVSFTKPTFVRDIAAEFDRLQRLGPIIDDVLRDVRRATT
jgi:hypothetical protein